MDWIKKHWLASGLIVLVVAVWGNSLVGVSEDSSYLVQPASSTFVDYTAETTPTKYIYESSFADPEPALSNNNYYTNVDGNRVHSPAYSDSVPSGASARCGDGTYSFSQNRRGTCSHHGGVDEWL